MGKLPFAPAGPRGRDGGGQGLGIRGEPAGHALKSTVEGFIGVYSRDYRVYRGL